MLWLAYLAHIGGDMAVDIIWNQNYLRVRTKVPRK
jgi:hypothetical protein